GVPALPLARARGPRAGRCRPGRTGRRALPRAAPGLARAHRRMNDVRPSAVVYPDVELGAGVSIGDNAVVGKRPTLGRRSTARREDELAPLVVGDGTAILACAVVFAGSRLGSGVIVGDQACVRERCELGDEVVIGRGSLVENDVTIGARMRVPALDDL